MAMNVVGNALFLTLIFVIMIGLFIGLTVLNRVYAAVVPIMAGLGFNQTDYPQFFQYTYYKSFFLNSFQFFLYLCIGVILFSSFFNATNFLDYLKGAIAGTLVSILLTYFVIVMWNYMGPVMPLLDLTDFSQTDLWFITNIQAIFFANLIASLLSFVFVQRGATSRAGVVG